MTNPFSTRSGPGGKFLLTGLGRAYLREAWTNPETNLDEIGRVLGAANHKTVYRLVDELGLGRKAKKKYMPKPEPKPKPEPVVEKRLHKGQTGHWPDDMPKFQDHPRADIDLKASPIDWR